MDKLLAGLAETVSHSADLESLTRPLLALLQQVSGMESTYLTTVDEAAGVQRILYSRNSGRLQITEGLQVPWADSLCKRALDQQQRYSDDVPQRWGDSAAARALGIQTFMTQAVRADDGQLLGTLCASSTEKVPHMADSEKLLDLFSGLIARQFEREALLARLQAANAELAAHALTDPLTGLANRRLLIEEAQRMLARAARDGSRVEVAFLDFDGFKAINDRHGHEAGDRFLAAMAKRMREGLRSADLVARYGGDEFVVLAPADPGSGDDGAALRARVEALSRGRVGITDGVDIDYAGASVGVVLSQPGESDADTLLARADAAMYAVKQQRKAARSE
jgi:diguanylate cyclase